MLETAFSMSLFLWRNMFDNYDHRLYYGILWNNRYFLLFYCIDNLNLWGENLTERDITNGFATSFLERVECDTIINESEKISTQFFGSIGNSRSSQNGKLFCHFGEPHIFYIPSTIWKKYCGPRHQKGKHEFKSHKQNPDMLLRWLPNG